MVELSLRGPAGSNRLQRFDLLFFHTKNPQAFA